MRGRSRRAAELVKWYLSICIEGLDRNYIQSSGSSQKILQRGHAIILKYIVVRGR
jgi:hypothetical protein